MNKTIASLLAVAVIALGLVGAVGYYAGKSSGQELGARTIGPAASAGLQSLYLNFESLLADITAQRTAAVGVASSASFGAIFLAGNGSSTSETSTDITGYSGLTVGDFCTVAESSPSSTFLRTCFVKDATTVTVLTSNRSTSAAGSTTTTSTVYATVLLRSRLGVPPALITSTSTTAGN